MHPAIILSWVTILLVKARVLSLNGLILKGLSKPIKIVYHVIQGASETTDSPQKLIEKQKILLSRLR